MENKTEKRQPLPLLRNVRYPTYQLWAVTGDVSSQDSILMICILETMQWLRERFREHDLPVELDLPQPDHYSGVAFSQLQSVHLRHGYQLDIVWLEEERSWSLQLIEPDHGPNPGQKKQSRLPVPGRLFETNISYQKTDKGILCGFRTMVSEPEGTDEPCEVFRLGVIKRLVRNPLAGLHQVFEIKEKTHIINSSADIRSFKKNLMSQDRTLPIVLVAEHTSQNTEKADLPNLEKILSNKSIGFSPTKINDLNLNDNNTKSQSDPELPSWLDAMAHKHMGYAQFFVVSETIRDEFCNTIPCDLPNGAILLMPSPQTDDNPVIYTHKKVTSSRFTESLDDILQNYSKYKTFNFTDCLFVPQAKEIQNDKMLKDIHDETELRRLYEDKLKRLEDQDNKHIAEIEGRHQREQRKLELELEKAINKKKAAEDTSDRHKKGLVKLNTEVSELAKRLEITKTRPVKPSGVCDWVTKYFNQRIIIHDRAKRLMKEVQNEELDLNLLCDALEYLAHEHWDMINEIIDDNECQRLCSLYYNRPFEYGECGDRNIRDYSSEYIVTYKKANVPLTHHLKVGKDPMRLVRIYYFYDKADKKIIVGSMPRHLRITSY